MCVCVFLSGGQLQWITNYQIGADIILMYKQLKSTKISSKIKHQVMHFQNGWLVGWLCFIAYQLLLVFKMVENIFLLCKKMLYRKPCWFGLE